MFISTARNTKKNTNVKFYIFFFLNKPFKQLRCIRYKITKNKIKLDYNFEVKKRELVRY